MKNKINILEHTTPTLCLECS